MLIRFISDVGAKSQSLLFAMNRTTALDAFDFLLSWRVNPGDLIHRSSVILIAGLICLGNVSWAQEVVQPQTVSPISSSPPAVANPTETNRVGQRYVIAKDDLLDIFVLGVPEVSRDYRIGADGMITLSMLPKPLLAEGLTLDQLSNAIRQAFLDAKLITDPQVVVTVKSSPLNSVVLSGAVKKPGVYAVYGHTTLLRVLTQAEGLSEDAGNTATVTRGQNAPEDPGADAVHVTQNSDSGSSHTVKVDVLGLWQKGEAGLDVDLYPGDRVTVQKAGIVYVIGAVNRAGGFVLNDQNPMTVLTAIALANNFTSIAKPSKTVIIRKNPKASGGREEIAVDLKKVLSNHAPDEQLLANDILFVPESGGKKALSTVMPSVLNAAVYRITY